MRNNKSSLSGLMGRYGNDVVIVVRGIPDRPAIKGPGP